MHVVIAKIAGVEVAVMTTTDRQYAEAILSNQFKNLGVQIKSYPVAV